MDTMPNDNKSLSAEVVLYDVLGTVFSNLNFKDLYRAAMVCKSWRDTANREILRRSEIQCLILPMPDGSDDDYESDESEDLKQKWEIIEETFRCPPYLVLLFCDTDRPTYDDPHDCYEYYERRLEADTHIGVFELSSVYLNTTAIIGDAGIGMMIPSTSRLKIDRYITNSEDVEDHAHHNTLFSIVEEAIDALIPTHEEHNCFILLLPRDETIKTYLGSDAVYCKLFFSKFLTSFKKKCKPGTYSLLGGNVSYLKFESDRSFLEMIFFIRLSGTAIKSWSIVLELNLTNTEAECILLNLKKNIQFKLKSVAFAVVPSNKNESHEQKLAKTEVFRRVFSGISLISLYQDELSFQIGCNSINCDPDPILQHKDSIAYLIISTE